MSTYPDEDSPDLSDEEIASAADTATPMDLKNQGEALLLLSCPSCGKRLQLNSQAIRRRKPDLFTRMKFVCDDKHELTKTFKINWLKRGS